MLGAICNKAALVFWLVHNEPRHNSDGKVSFARDLFKAAKVKFESML